MNLYQITIEEDTTTWKAESIMDAIELAWDDQVVIHEPETQEQTAELRRWFVQEGLEAVIWIGALENP
ncbi:MAG: hypothetical protein MJA83_20090 [Gammaproteobacteria bacterium]|nr:hypothetical protein [Gammaproteobacteria bacterium]